MDIKRTYAIFLRQFYLIRDNPTRFFQMFVWITVDVILWGFMSRYIAEVAGPGFSYLPALLGAVILWNFLIRVMQGITMAFMEDSWSRNILNMFASPLSISEYIGGFVLTSIGTSILVLFFMFVLAAAFFGFTAFSYGITIVPYLIILFISGIALGILGVTVMLRLGPSAEWLVWPIPALISPFVGVTYPLSILPSWMQNIGHMLPPSYVFEGVRATMNGGVFSMGDFVIGLLLALFFVLLAYRGFVRVYRTAVRTGLIARYSAESVS
ncbi:MAG: hypothetical protein RL681_247 [Candidatus Parcubacteria bacterium]|jgi:ABC-2 type transport system permease protein